MISRIFLLILFVTTSSVTTWGQSRLEKGYYISSSNDTVLGSCRVSSMSPMLVRFQRKGSKKNLALRPDSVLQVVCGERKVVGAEVEVEVSHYVVDEMDTVPTLNLVKKHVFLVEAAGGSRPFYWFIDRYQRPQIYIVEDRKYVLLKYKKYKWYASKTETYVVENNDFRLQLAKYFDDDHIVNTLLQTTHYKIEDIKKLFETFDQYSPNQSKTDK